MHFTKGGKLLGHEVPCLVYMDFDIGPVYLLQWSELHLFIVYGQLPYHVVSSLLYWDFFVHNQQNNCIANSPL